MEFDSPGDYTILVKPTFAGPTLDLSLEELDAILEVDVVDTVPPITDS